MWSLALLRCSLALLRFHSVQLLIAITVSLSNSAIAL